ncbi:hypothetical protein J8K62_02020 [Streptococcus suis]|nr:hypothetical protein [Streptococcus suis]MBL3696613.1 hypothetical protein [Streptococcus suis]MBM6382086.1 hypothetical protein [Streptococcus suis]MBM6388785.1 hypothetical protein [Streptococcus suis]MBM6391774.1 hypothetical protein [Streptococcus suis]
MLPYPFSYFSSIFSPRNMFANRRLINLWQRLFTTLFLVALLLIPSSLQTVNLETYPLENFVEGIYSPLTDQVVGDLRQHAVIENNHLTYTGNTNWEQVTFGDTVSSSSDFTYQFANQSLTIRKGSDILSELTYEGLNTDDFASKEALTAAISKKWYQANRAAVGLSITLISTFILTTNLLFILLGASFFLFLTKKSRFFHFETFAECYNFALNCLGLPTLIACLIGLFGQPVTTLLTIQNILFVLCLLWVFFKTKFRDEI